MKNLKILKRDGSEAEFEPVKISNAISKASGELPEKLKSEEITSITESVVGKIDFSEGIPSVEQIQDLVEITLMEYGKYDIAKRYILYRKEKSIERDSVRQISGEFEGEVSNDLKKVLREIQKDFDMNRYSLSKLESKFRSFIIMNLDNTEKLDLLIKAASELTTVEEPKWEFISARFFSYKVNRKTLKINREYGFNELYDKVEYFTQRGLYAEALIENYSKKDFRELEAYIDPDRDKLFTFGGIELISKRYLLLDEEMRSVETIQEMFMLIAMHLASREKEKVEFSKKFYDIISLHYITVATPTLSNARKKYHQLSSCFIDTLEDSLKGIYRSIDNFAQVSKFGGGMGLYFGKVRAKGSTIRGYKNIAGGVTQWIKLANDTAVAVDQLGVRKGSCAVYLDIWHKDILEFLQLKTNNGDDRSKAHDIFPAITYPNCFFRLIKEDINQMWYLFDPHEIKTVMGFELEDSFGDEWEEKYRKCVNNKALSREEIPLKELVRLIIKSNVETGTPFAFFRDNVNEMNPNPHKGMIYCSNLCTEICQNTSAIRTIESKLINENGSTYHVDISEPGDFVVCNLASLCLGNIPDNREKLKDVVRTAVRLLDNVIDITYYPTEYARKTNGEYRALGLGVNGYHHYLAKHGIKWESDEHLKAVDELFEDIAYYAIEASHDLSSERGSYPNFRGSDWNTGDYFRKRGYSSDRWKELEIRASEGMRNGYLMAVAPTSSTSVIVGTTASIDPVINKFYLEEKKGSVIPRVAPELDMKTMWLYKNAHYIDRKYIIDAASVRQKHIDQSQSLNIYINPDMKLSEILNVYMSAAEKGIKTLYYFRSRSLETEVCESCSS